MIAVLFEAWVAEGQQPRYLDLAAALKPSLDHIDGFVSLERFQSLSEPGKLLSLSYWRDEAAVAAWRALPAHRHAQTEGREVILTNYRLRIAAVIREYGPTDRRQAPADSRVAHPELRRPPS